MQLHTLLIPVRSLALGAASVVLIATACAAQPHADDSTARPTPEATASSRSTSAVVRPARGAGSAASTVATDAVALTGGIVHTMVPGAKPAPMTILIENERIAAVGPDVEIPAGARTVDVSGLHVIPGLIDAFVNHDPDHDRLYVAAGVTLVRDIGNDHTRIIAEAMHDARKRSPGPALWVAGGVLDGNPPSTRSAVVLENSTDAAIKLPRLLVEPIDYLSFQPGLPHDAWEKTLEVAHMTDKDWVPRQVWGPLARGATLKEAIEKKQDGFYSLDVLLPEKKLWEQVTPADFDAVVAAAGAARVALTPLIAVFARSLIHPGEGSTDLEYLGPIYETMWSRDLEARERVVNEAWLKSGLELLEKRSKVLARLHEAGCRLVPGSGAPNPWHMPGEGLLDELALWKRAGIPAAECVRLATQGAAEAIGETKRGTIERAKFADLVLTKGDPTEDIANLHAPAMVVLRGRVMPRAELDVLLEGVKAQQDKVKEALRKPLDVEAPDLPAGDVVLTGHVETRGLGTRISAEKYAVVRRYDGSLTYCGRVVIPGVATTPGTETTVMQTVQGGELVELDVKMISNRRTITVHGELAGGKFSIEQRMDDAFVGTHHLKERISMVDCGSVTAHLILGYHKKPGKSHVLFFDDYEPATGLWEMKLDQDALHLVRTPTGMMKVSFDEKGNIQEVQREAGNGILQTKPIEVKVVDGKGLPMSADKRALVPQAAKAAPADAPKSPDAKVPPKEPPK
jgi:hypothetical protein